MLIRRRHVHCCLFLFHLGSKTRSSRDPVYITRSRRMSKVVTLRGYSINSLLKDCYSLDQFDDEFISIFDGHASETLTDLGTVYSLS